MTELLIRVPDYIAIDLVGLWNGFNNLYWEALMFYLFFGFIVVSYDYITEHESWKDYNIVESMVLFSSFVVTWIPAIVYTINSLEEEKDELQEKLERKESFIKTLSLYVDDQEVQEEVELVLRQ